MKIYKKSKDTFFVLSILTLLTAMGCFHYNKYLFGNFLLGLFASSFIVYIQSFINYKIELSRTLIPFLKDIDNALFEIKNIIDDSLEYAILYFPDNYYKIKDYIEKLNLAIFNACDIKSLSRKNKENLNLVKNKIIELGKETCLIFKYFDDSPKEDRRYLFINLYNILNNFDFGYIEQVIFNIADKVDFKAYLSRSTVEQSNHLFDEIAMKKSKKVYIEFIKNKYKIEYKALKSNFDLIDKKNELSLK